VLSIAGSIGLGLVWGWLVARLTYRARWFVVVRVLIGLILQGLLVLFFTSPRAVMAFAGAVALAALVGWLWVRTLELRYGATG
jgi:hypothetical protein